MNFSCSIGMNLNWLETIHKNGYRFYESSFNAVAAADEDTLKRLKEKAASLYMTSCSYNGMFPQSIKLICGKDGYGDVERYLDGALNKALNFESRVITLGSGVSRMLPDGMSKEEGIEIFSTILADLIVPICSARGYKVSIEPLRKEESNFLNNCCEVYEVVKNVNSPFLGITDDYYHSVLGGDTLSDIKTFGKHIFHVHMASPKRGRLYPNIEDREDLTEFFKALKSVDYNSAVSLEGGGGDDFAESTATAMKIMADAAIYAGYNNHS